MSVLAGGTWNLMGGALSVGYYWATGNTLTVDGGIVTNAGTLTVGNNLYAGGNSVTVANGGQLLAAKVALGPQCGGNGVLVTAGGLLEAGAVRGIPAGCGIQYGRFGRHTITVEKPATGAILTVW